MDEPLDLFIKLGKSDSSDEQHVQLSLRLCKPQKLEYIIRSFLDEKLHIDPELFERKIKLLHGVDSNFPFEMYGDIDYPDEFKSKRCELLVDPLAGSDYLEYAGKGYAGDGWYEKEHFVFRLYISPQMARDIIDRRLLAEHVEEDWKMTEAWKKDDDWVWMRLRLDITNYTYPVKRRESEHKVCFDITSVYC